MTNYEIAQTILKQDLSGIKYSYKMLQTPDELLQTRKGDCFEQVELARHLLSKQNITCKSYFMEMNREDNIGENFVAHGFIVFQENDKFYWLERAYCGGKFIGVHQYNTLKELLSDFVVKTIETFENTYKKPTKNIRIRQYDAPIFPISYTNHVFNCLNSQEIDIENL